MKRYQLSGVLSTKATQQIDNCPFKRIIGQTIWSASPNRGTVQRRGPQIQKEESEGENCICPICLEIIIDCNEQNEGHGAFYCEGWCDEWL